MRRALLSLAFVLCSLLVPPSGWAGGVGPASLTVVNAMIYSSLNAAVTAIGGTTTTLEVSSLFTAGSNTTIPANVTLRFTGGGQLSCGTATITINGPVDAPAKQIFDNTCAAGEVLFGASGPRQVWQKWFGAAEDDNGTSGTDDTPAFQKAIAALGAYGGTVSIINDSYYGAGVTIAARGLAFQGAGKFHTILRYGGSSDFLTFGSYDGTESSYNGCCQDYVIQDLTIKGPGGGIGSAGTTRAIVDWQSGGAHLNRVIIKNFGTGYFGFNADISIFNDVNFNANGRAVHLANRSDQVNFVGCYFLYNEAGLWIEYARNARVFGGQFVNNPTYGDIVLWAPGTGTSTQGIAARTIVDFSSFGTWFESLVGSTVAQHIHVGKDGDNTRILQGVVIREPHLEAAATTNFVQVDAGTHVYIDNGDNNGSFTAALNIATISGVTPIVGSRFPVSTTMGTITGNTGRGFTLRNVVSGNPGLDLTIGGTNRFQITNAGEGKIGGVTGDGAGKAVCIKSDGMFGTCTDVPNASGVCTCS